MGPDETAAITALADDYVDELHGEWLACKPAKAARLLGVDERTVRRLIASGRLEAIHPSSRLTLIPRWSLYAFLGLTDPQPSLCEAATR